SPTYLWPSKETFMTDFLFSSPRLCFSEAQKKAVLKWAKEMSMPVVPALNSLKRCRENIKNIIGDGMEKVQSASGNIFYLNSVARAISLDYANPLTRLAMMDYPKNEGFHFSDHFSGEKMLFASDDIATPSVSVDKEIFFVDELLQCHNGRYFIPQCFFYSKPASIYGPENTYESDPEWLLCAAGFGRRVLAVPLIIFMDDVSGNISKQWNKHHAIYMSNANLPREMIEKEFCIRFVTSSPHASPMELMTAMKDSISQSGVIAYDAKYNEEVFLLPYGFFFGSDNPMQAEECSHGGLRCNLFCRTCKVGGTKAFKQSDEGFASLFKSSEIRTPEETAKEIHHHIELAALPGGMQKVLNTRSSSGIHDSATDAIVNCLLEMGRALRKSLPGVNIHLDTPMEILHTVLLGVVKYFWGQTVFILEKLKSLEIFHTRLSSLNAEGLHSVKLSADYLCQYKGMVLNGWTVIGRLVVLLWHTTIEDREAYLAELSCVIEDFLMITAQCAPSILLSKPKFHFLIHIPGYIRRFGPAILFSTERYDNRQAPSRDSCRTFAIHDRMKHIVFGGYWLDPISKRWIMGLICQIKGTAKLSYAKSKALGRISQWRQTQCALILGSMSNPNDTFYKADNFISLHGDTAQINQNVIIDISGKLFVAKVIEILVPNDGTNLATKIGVQTFDFLPTLHSTLHLPCLQLSDQKFVISPTNILCTINIQHDCPSGKCDGIKMIPITQERLEAKKTRHTVIHSDSNIFILNTHSLHNYEYIRAVVPPHLTPKLLVEDADDIRRNAAKHIRESKTGPTMDDDIIDSQPEARAFETSSKNKGKGKVSGQQQHAKEPGGNRSGGGVKAPEDINGHSTHR
ncbi:hypothetical protein BD779DRAFT_1446717, partial [Infundibulicybe gibba]